MNKSELECEIMRREQINYQANLWKEKLKALLTRVGERRAEPVRFDPVLEFFPTLTVTAKNAHLSALYKELDVYFQEGEYMMAHKKYTQCITHAPAGNNLLALGYGYRGIALYFGNYMKDCLIDIERAMKHSYPNSLKPDLFTWKAAALQKLGMKKTLINRALVRARRELSSDNDPEEIKKMKERIEEIKLLNTGKLKCYNLNFKDAALPPLKSRNPIVPGLSKSVELKYSDKYGRYIVATQDIKAGDVIGIQKPYASVVRMNVNAI